MIDGRYTDAERQCIAKAARCRDEETLNAIIGDLEKFVRLNSSPALINAKQDRKLWNDVSKKTESLASALARIEWWDPSPFDHIRKHGEIERAAFVTKLNELAEYSRVMSSFSNRLVPSVRVSKNRWLFRGVFCVWTDRLGFKLRFSRDADTKRVKGPLWDFFEAAATPVLGTNLPSRETFADAVEAEKQRRAKRQLTNSNRTGTYATEENI